MLVEVDVRIDGDVFDDVAFEFEGIDRFAFGVGNERLDLRLVGTPHRLYY